MVQILYEHMSSCVAWKDITRSDNLKREIMNRTDRFSLLSAAFFLFFSAACKLCAVCLPRPSLLSSLFSLSAYGGSVWP